MSATEAQFEEHIASWLVEHGGYQRAKVGNAQDEPKDFDAEAGVDTTDLVKFIADTQTGICRVGGGLVAVDGLCRGVLCLWAAFRWGFVGATCG